MFRVLRGFQSLSKMVAIICGLFMFVMVIFVFISMIARYVFDRPFTITEEISGYLIVFAVYMGLGYTFRTNGHIRTTILIDRVPKKFYKTVNLTGMLIALVWSFIVLIASIALVNKYWISGTTSLTTLATPLWIPTIFMGLGSLLLCIDIVAKMTEVVLNNEIELSSEEINQF